MKRQEVADLFGVNATTVDRWARDGILSIAVIRTPTGQLRYKRDECHAIAESIARGGYGITVRLTRDEWNMIQERRAQASR